MNDPPGGNGAAAARRSTETPAARSRTPGPYSAASL
jgi:hypothetical protein